jgi:hypothetical protein
MKNIRIIILSFLFINSISTFAQDPDYTGPAKIYVKAFWKNVEAFKSGKGGSAQNLERGIKNTKEADPAYNTSAMEAEAKIWKEKSDQTQSEKKEKANQDEKIIEEKNQELKNSVGAKNNLEYLFKDANLQVGHNNIEFAQKRLDDFKAKTEGALKTSNPSQDYVKYISKFKGTMPQFYQRNKALLADINNVEEYQPAFMELQLYEAYWDAAQKIYPAEAEFKTAYNELVNYKKSVGSLNDVKNVSDKNSAEKIKSTKMESPKIKDASLEKYTSDAFNTRFGKVYGIALKVVLTQDGWTTEKNSLTGITTGHYRSTQLAYKGNDGKCYLLSGILYIHEDYVGNSFTNRTLVYDGLGGKEMLCENVK